MHYLCGSYPCESPQSSFGIDVRFTGTRVSNRYSLNRSLNDTHDHRLTLDSPPNSGVASLACFIDSRAKNLRRCVWLPPYTPASLSVVYSKIFRRASGGSSGDNNMRLMTAADRPEPLWLALRMVQVGASSEPKRLGLLVEGHKPRVYERLPEFPDLRGLSRFHFCND